MDLGQRQTWGGPLTHDLLEGEMVQRSVAGCIPQLFGAVSTGGQNGQEWPVVGRSFFWEDRKHEAWEDSVDGGHQEIG